MFPDGRKGGQGGVGVEVGCGYLGEGISRLWSLGMFFVRAYRVYMGGGGRDPGAVSSP